MGDWKFASTPDDDGTVLITVTLSEDDADGAITGTVIFRQSSYTVKGEWAAAGSVSGRKASVFWFGGSCEAVATQFLVAAGDLGMHGTQQFMNISVVTASSGDGRDFGYNGQLAAV
jgi:hypothetical protein